ncbi:DUF6069 family protein [Nocardiopsis sp. CC223A]|uniref:DUF6069 family protein n=1 Tax=Nocardiopsis sp. CC223A TaxID=3044051 RepID=UPI00278C4BB9|nr:DUF6069 family protein [Nocardiopsis sp. CC223A]
MTATSAAPVEARSPWRPRLIAIGAVALLNGLLGLVAPLLGADLVTAPEGAEPMTLNAVPFVLFSVVFAFLGWGVLALAERFLGRRGLIAWTVVAVLFTLVSFVPSLSVNATPATEAVLVASHVVVAAVVIPAFWRSSPTA